jgi:hypothetical protein
MRAIGNRCGKAGKRQIVGVSNVPADCLRCGVCCHSQLTEYVRVTGLDWTRLGPEAEQWAHFVGHRAFLRMREGHCAALEIRPLQKGEREFFCRIYERRPQVCRDLGRGTPQCWGELEAKAERVAAAAAQ